MIQIVSSLMPLYIDIIPDRVEPGVLYVSRRFATAIHLCACGCGKEVVTPLSKGEWKIQGSAKIVSLYPSIGNWEYPCQSHYWIKQNKIVWAGKIPRRYIEASRARDNANIERLYCSDQRNNEYLFYKFVKLLKELFKKVKG